MNAAITTKGLISALTLVAATTFSSQTTATPFYGHTLSQGLEDRKIVSFLGRRFQHLVRQETDFSCGAAALATILKYAYRIDVTEADILEGMFSVSDPVIVQRQGFSLLDIKNYVNGIGMRGRGYKVDLESLEKNPYSNHRADGFERLQTFCGVKENRE